MRSIPDQMADDLAAGAARFCHVWRLVRTDGETLGFTDHDQSFPFLGIVCEASSGLTQGVAHQALDGEAGSAAVSGSLDSSKISETGIRAGVYDEAEIFQYVINWKNPEIYKLSGRGRLARLECRGGLDDTSGSFIAHIEGPFAPLARTIGRCFGSLCDATLGDARCGLSSSAISGRACNKSYNTCCAVFGNVVNFRGFPDLPGEDFLTAYARDGDALDGASRGQGSGR